MRAIVFVKATKSSEEGVMPTTELMEAMGKFNQGQKGCLRRRQPHRRQRSFPAHQ